MSDPAVRQVYRRLLRAASASVRFSRPATRSLRKLLREDIEAPAPAPYAERTMALFLLASLYARPVHGPYQENGGIWRPDSASHAAHLAHDLTANLASLTYHHLSPNTPMQRKRVGGTSSSTAARKQSVVTEALSALDDTSSEPTSTQHVDVLRVLPKPVRGPAGFKPVYWDAQHPEKHLRASSAAELEALQTRLTELAEQYAALTEAHGPKDRRTIDAKARMVDLRGSLKGMRKAEANRHAEEELAARPKRALYDLVRGLAASESLWLGVPRWTRWKNGEYLAP